MSFVVIHLSQNDKFDEIVGKYPSVILDFYADWCGPCNKLTPVLEEKLESKNVTLIKINVDDFADLSEKYNVNGIPHVVLLKDGKKVKEFVGFNMASLDDIIALL
jgi:thioredoxin 1